MVAKKKKPLELGTMNVANEINLDAAVEAGVSDFYDIFTLKDKHKNGTEGFSQWTTLLCFTLLPGVLILQYMAASHMARSCS